MQFDLSLESYSTVLYCGTVCFTMQCGSNFFICEPCSVTTLWKATRRYCTVVLFVLLYSVVLTFSSVDQTMQCDHSL